MSPPLKRSRPRVLVFGYGNPGRQDDGAGPAVAEALERMDLPNLTVWINDQLTIEDSIAVATADVVCFVDAARTGRAGIAVHPVEAAETVEVASHALSPEALLAIARDHFGAVPPAYMVALRGRRFGLGEGLSPEVAANVAVAAGLIRRGAVMAETPA